MILNANSGATSGARSFSGDFRLFQSIARPNAARAAVTGLGLAFVLSFVAAWPANAQQPAPEPAPAAEPAAPPAPAAKKPPAVKKAPVAKKAPAASQAPAAQAPDAAPAAQPQVSATPGPITPSQLAAARALVIASGMSRSFTVIIPQFVNQIGSSLTETRPELTEDLKAVFEQLRPEFEKQADEMTDIAGQIFAKHMSEADLTAAVAFFSSAAGKQYVAAQPAILSDLVTAMQGWQGKISTNMMTRVREEMKKKGHDV